MATQGYPSSSSSSTLLAPPSPQLAIIESRLSTVESRLSGIESRLSGIEAHLTNLAILAPSLTSPPPPPTPRSQPSLAILVPPSPDAIVPATFYKFQLYDAGNNVLTLPDDSRQRPVFKITTTRGPSLSGGGGGTALERTVVKLLPSSSGSAISQIGEEGSLEGGIDWRSKRIGVLGVSKYVDEVKGKASGPMSLQTEWTWHTGTYTVTLNHSRVLTWTVSRNERELAIYTPLRKGGPRGLILANLKFVANDITNEERIFLILILMYHDFQKPALGELQGSSDGYGEAAAAVMGEIGTNMVANAAGTATGNAVASCCVAQ